MTRLIVTGAVLLCLFATAAVAPGGSITTITVNGDVILGAGSVLPSDVQGSEGYSDTIIVNGDLEMVDANTNQIYWLPLPPQPGVPPQDNTAKDSVFGGVYTVATYTGTGPTATGNTENLGGNIDSAYIKEVIYDADLGGGVHGVTVELHPQGAGDTDLDGDVDGDDLAIFGLAWSPSGNDNTWSDGDFDFDGDIDGDDLAVLGLAWAPGGISFPSGNIEITVVPEPGTIVMLLMAVAGLLAYRKRR